MTYGSSIFTSWFQIICGSQRSQLEFVLWWCGGYSDIHYGINSIDIMGCCTPQHAVAINQAKSHGNRRRNVFSKWGGGRFLKQKWRVKPDQYLARRRGVSGGCAPQKLKLFEHVVLNEAIWCTIFHHVKHLRGMPTNQQFSLLRTFRHLCCLNMMCP